MKDSANQILGKTITGVIVKQSRTGRPPRSQLFLVFDDHTSYEFYSDSTINPTGGIDRMSFREVYNYMNETMEVVFNAVQDPDGARSEL